MTTTARDPFDVQVGERLRTIRKNSRYSQTELAALAVQAGLPFSQQTVSDIERGARALLMREAHALSRVLGQTLDPYAALTQVTVSRSTTWRDLRALEQRVDELTALLRAAEQPLLV